MNARLDLTVPDPVVGQRVAGVFVSIPRMVGSTDAEMIAWEGGHLPAARREAIAASLRAAADSLASKESLGSC